MMHIKTMTRHVSKLLLVSMVAVLALLAVVISPLFSFGQPAGAQGSLFGIDKRVPQS